MIGGIPMNHVRTQSFIFVLALWIASGVFAASSSTSSSSNSSGGVTVKATYSSPQPQNELRFEIVVDTHTVDLDGYDLGKLALLRDAGGKTHEAMKVEAKGSGHHRSAEIYFPRPPGGAQQVDLVIKDIAGVKERVFHFHIS
jgi:hypothetical protein